MVKQRAKKYRITNSKSDKIFDAVNIVIMILLLFIFVWPLWFVVISSFSNPYEVWKGNVLIWFKGFTLKGYEQLFNYDPIWIGYRNTIFYTVFGTAFNLLLTLPCAYSLSRRDFRGRKGIMLLFTFTMFFSGGMIPLYLIIRNLGMIDTVWAVVLPGAISVHNLIIAKSFFSSSIPFELQESAFVDGCSNIRTLLTIIIPLSAPILAVLTMYYGVAHWNAYFNAMMYLSDSKKFPLQIALREILMTNSIADATDTTMNSVDQILLYEGLKYAVVIVASLPVMCLYPFLQRYFVKGTMIGAVKG